MISLVKALEKLHSYDYTTIDENEYQKVISKNHLLDAMCIHDIRVVAKRLKISREELSDIMAAIVATTFLPKPISLNPFFQRKDKNKYNNAVSNLEWVQ